MATIFDEGVKLVDFRGIPAHIEAWEQPSGDVALWNGRGHVMVSWATPAEGLRAALCNLGYDHPEWSPSDPMPDD